MEIIFLKMVHTLVILKNNVSYHSSVDLADMCAVYRCVATVDTRNYKNCYKKLNNISMTFRLIIFYYNLI